MDRTVVGHDQRQRFGNRISLLSFVGVSIWTNPSEVRFFANFMVLLGFDVRERFLFQLKHFDSDSSKRAIHRLPWNVFERQIRLRAHDSAIIMSLIDE